MSLRQGAERGACISGLGGFVPDKILTNHDLEKMVDTSDEWIRTRTGIRERRIASPDSATSDLAVEASKLAIEDAGLTPDEIDLIICATVTPDCPFPSTACFIQHRLGNKRAAAFDISAACSGFIYAVSLADLFIKSGQYKNILVIGAETLSKITDWEDRSTCVLFGDGAGAVVVTPSDGESRILSSHLFADGAYTDLLALPGGGSRFPCSYEVVDNRLNYIKMKGNETFKVAVKSMVSAALLAIKTNHVCIEEIDLLVPHQANDRIIKAVAQRLNLPDEKVVISLDRFGNTSAASIPLALWDASQHGRLAKGSVILLVAFGGGLTWGSSLIRW